MWYIKKIFIYFSSCKKWAYVCALKENARQTPLCSQIAIKRQRSVWWLLHQQTESPFLVLLNSACTVFGTCPWACSTGCSQSCLNKSPQMAWRLSCHVWGWLCPAIYRLPLAVILEDWVSRCIQANGISCAHEAGT